MSIKQRIIVVCFGLSLVGGIYFADVSNAAAPGPSANGSGLLAAGPTPGGGMFRRQFSFSVKTDGDGTVTGQAVLHNPDYDGDQGNRPYALHVDVSCMKIVGNIAFFGGMTRRTTDPNLVDAVYWSIQDNGEPGIANDKISLAYFFDDDPDTTGNPQLCQGIQLGDFPMTSIIGGNIRLRP